MTNEYQRDEFDEIAERGGPVGVHRAPRPWWTLLLVPLLVFLAAGLVAFLYATFLWNSGSTADPSASPTPSATVTTEPTTEPTGSAAPEPSETASAEPEPEPSETAEPEPVIVFDAPVAVLNGTGISGLAADQADLLTAGGFTDVTAANLGGDEPDVNTVVYADESLADTAAEVASLLGFDAIEQGTPSSDADIEAQIVSDPR